MENKIMKLAYVCCFPPWFKWLLIAMVSGYRGTLLLYTVRISDSECSATVGTSVSPYLLQGSGNMEEEVVKGV